jgi:DNA-binding transcriptional LysR family regulator
MLMNISLRQLKAFLGVAGSGSFTKTAQRLHLSQAALSAIIRELESQLKCRLLDRTTRTVSLTEAGRVFRPTATQIVEMLDNSALELGKIGRENQRVLRVGVTPHIAVSLIPSVLKHYATLEPSVRVEIVDSQPGDLLRSVEAGDLDAAYGAFFAKVSGIDRVPIFPTPLAVVSSLTDESVSLNNDQSGVAWQTLQDRALICFPEDNPIQRLIEENLSKEKITTGPRTRVGHLETAIAMVEAGFGITVVPSISEATCRRFCVNLNVIQPVVELSFYCITRAGRGNIETIKQFSNAFNTVAMHSDKSASYPASPVKHKKKSRQAAGKILVPP